MKKRPATELVLALTVLAGVLAGCERQPTSADPLPLAESFIDAFYAWEADRLKRLVAPGKDADRVLYYQGWAEAAHYEIAERRPCHTADGVEIVCAITVTDDFGQALGYAATDTFTLTVRDGLIMTVSFEGDDPPIFAALFDWLSETRPEVFSGPCAAMFDGGSTPGDCARAIAQGARDFMARAPE